MLDLVSDKWAELRDAYGPATKIPGLLKQLASNTSPMGPREEPWFSLWSALCHQGEIYTASYAAVPHIIQIGHHATGLIDPNFFRLPQAVFVKRLMGEGPHVPEELLPSFFGSMPHLLKIKLALNEKPALEDDGSNSLWNKDGLCKQCGHQADPHLIVALHEDRTKGGVIFCPEEGCGCFHTWGLDPNSGDKTETA